MKTLMLFFTFFMFLTSPSLAQIGSNSGGGSSGPLSIKEMMKDSSFYKQPLDEGMAVYSGAFSKQIERLFEDDKMSSLNDWYPEVVFENMHEEIQDILEKYAKSPYLFSVPIEEEILAMGRSDWNAFVEEVFSNTYDKSLPSHTYIIEEYKDFLTGNEYIGSDERDNIYSLFLDSRQDGINDEDIRILFHYWQTDLESPSNLLRYRQDSHGGLGMKSRLNWAMVQEDIEMAISHVEASMPYEATSNVLLHDSHWAYQYEDRVYFNPHREKIAGVWLDNNIYFRMDDVRDFIGTNQLPPSLVHLPLHNVEMVILEDGQRISQEELKVLIRLLNGNLSFMPESTLGLLEEGFPWR